MAKFQKKGATPKAAPAPLPTPPAAAADATAIAAAEITPEPEEPAAPKPEPPPADILLGHNVIVSADVAREGGFRTRTVDRGTPYEETHTFSRQPIFVGGPLPAEIAADPHLVATPVYGPDPTGDDETNLKSERLQ